MVQEKKTTEKYKYAAGKRKEAVARVRLYKPTAGKVKLFEKEFKKGDIVVNGKLIEEYFNFKPYAPRYNKLLKEAGVGDEFVISARVMGGGISGQLDAIVHGIARALDKLDREKYHSILKPMGALTRDARTRERRKVGNAGKARRKKSSPKR